LIKKSVNYKQLLHAINECGAVVLREHVCEMRGLYVKTQLTFQITKVVYTELFIHRLEDILCLRDPDQSWNQ